MTSLSADNCATSSHNYRGLGLLIAHLRLLVRGLHHHGLAWLLHHHGLAWLLHHHLLVRLLHHHLLNWLLHHHWLTWL